MFCGGNGCPVNGSNRASGGKGIVGICGWDETNEVFTTALREFTEWHGKPPQHPEMFAVWFHHYFAQHHAAIGKLAKSAARLSAM